MALVDRVTDTGGSTPLKVETSDFSHAHPVKTPGVSELYDSTKPAGYREREIYVRTADVTPWPT